MAEVPDFRFRSQFPIAQIAALISQKQEREQAMRIKEEQLNLQKDQAFQQRFEGIARAVEAGQRISQNAIANSQARKDRQTRERLATNIQRINQPPTRLPEQVPGLAPQIQAPAFPTQQARVAQARADATRLRIADPNIAAQLFPKAQITPAGTPPKSIEAFVVGKLNAGEFGDPNSKEAFTAAVAEIQSAEPKTIKYTDENGNEVLLNPVLNTQTNLTQQTRAPKTGKDFRTQFFPNELEEITKAQAFLRTDPVTREIRSSLEKANVTRQLIKGNQPGSIGFIRTQLAKAAGEQRITDADIERFSGSPAIADKIKRKLQEWIKGNLTEADREDYLIMIDIAEKANVSALEDQLDSQINGLSFDVSGANKAALRKKLGANIIPLMNRSRKQIQNRSQQQRQKRQALRKKLKLKSVR